MELLQEYFKLQKEIYEYFGYVEDWVVIPLNDGTDWHWHLSGEGSGNFLRYASDEDALNDPDMNYYEGAVYTQKFLPKWVYRTDLYTMVCVDTKCDGNKFLMVLDNSKEHALQEHLEKE